MIDCNPSLLHFIKYAYVCTLLTIVFYLNYSRYKLLMLMYFTYRPFESNYYKIWHRSSNFPFIKIKFIHFYSIFKIQSLYISTHIEFTELF